MEEIKKIRVAQIVGDSTCGGVISCLMNYYRNMPTDVTFDFFTYGPSDYDEEIRSMGGEVIYFPKVFRFGAAVDFLSDLLVGYDIAHVHMTTLSLVGLIAAKNAGVGVRICHAHSTTDRQEGYRAAIKELLRYPTRCFATDRMGCSERSCLWLFGPVSATVLHNAIDLERFVPQKNRATLRKKMGLDGRFVYGFVGRFERQKNVPFLLRAFAYVVAKEPDCALLLVGSGSKKREIESLIEEYDLTGNVLIMPESKRVEEYYAVMDVFTLPSLFEGLPLVAVEAQAMGLPCLLSDRITPEVSLGGVCRFCSVSDERVWAEAMLAASALKGVACHRALQENGYDIKKEAPKLAGYYKERLL